MKCEKCQFFKTIGNTSETNAGLCAYYTSFFPVKTSDKCHLRPDKTLRCRDCARFETDTACMTCQADDSAITNGLLCSGFIDKHEVDVLSAIHTWRMRGEDYRAKIQQLLTEEEALPPPGTPKSGSK